MLLVNSLALGGCLTLLLAGLLTSITTSIRRQLKHFVNGIVILVKPPLTVKIIKNEEEYDQALARAEEIFDALPDTPEGDELAVLLLVIKDYENKHHPVLPPDPIEAIKLTMQEKGVK